jgi:hypothetical protein
MNNKASNDVTVCKGPIQDFNTAKTKSKIPKHIFYICLPSGRFSKTPGTWKPLGCAKGAATISKKKQNLRLDRRLFAKITFYLF